MTDIKKVELSNKIKEAAFSFNTLLLEASVLKLKVNVTQAFHPMQNANGAPINAPLNVTITETLEY